MSTRRIAPAMFDRFSGLKNTSTEERLTATDLAVAQNVDIDDAGQVRRRRGFTQVASGDFHSLFSYRDSTYVVKNGDLCQLYPDYTTFVLEAGVGTDPIAYVGVDGLVYFSSESANGVIEEGAVRPWGRVSITGEWWSPVVNPAVNLPEVAGTLLRDPPTATALTYYNGRIYLASNDVIWATQLYAYELVDATKNFIHFEHEVTDIVAVTDGIYVGTAGGVYFLAGAFNSMQRRQVLTTAPFRGSMIAVDPKHLGENGQNSRMAVMFLTPTGLCVGLDGGVCYNTTRDTFRFPTATSVSAMFRDQDGMGQYVGVAENTGGPTSKARFGDRVDVEIRRFQET